MAMQINLNDLILDALEKYVFPAVDKKVQAWKTPFEIDDKVWAKIKEEIRKALAKAAKQGKLAELVAEADADGDDE